MVSEKIVEAIKVLVKEDLTHAHVYYLFITQDKMIVADLLKKSSQPVSQGRAIALGGVVGQAILHVQSARKDTAEKKDLRAILDAYEKTRDKSMLASLSLDQILEADPGIEIARNSRIIPFSSVSKLSIKKPGRFMEGKINVAWQVTGTSLSGREYSTSYSRELIVAANRWEARKLFPAIIELLHGLYPMMTTN